MHTWPRFIVVDDDKFNNALCTMVIGKVCKEAEVITFHDPVAGFNYIVAEYPKFEKGNRVVLLLDINMPQMDGWEFLDKLNKILEQKKELISNRINIFVLSSSVDNKDIEKAQNYAYVTDYIIKPITKATISQIINGEKPMP